MNFPKHIFKAYDVRGVVREELTEELFYRIGRAAVVYTNAKKVFVGGDMRTSTDSFKKALISGLTDQGADVVDIGLISTPLLGIMTMRSEDADLGIMITASHNPAKYNGCKFINRKTMGAMGLDSGLDQIRNMTEKYEFADVENKGSVERVDLSDEYMDFTRSLIDLESLKKLKVVIDMGNGIEGVLIDKLVAGLPLDVEYLYKEPDGSFPNHEANPIKEENMRDLQAKVLENKADIGFAFDADADRVGLVDEKGEIVSGDKIIALLVPELLKKYPEAPIIYDLRSTKSVADVAKAYGSRSIESRVGHVFIKQEMRKEDAALGGELSGHFYYKDLFGFESGDLTLLYILKIVSESGKTVSELVKQFSRYYHSGEINFETDKKDETISMLEKEYGAGAKRISKIDGVKIEFEDWWFSVRKSNTEPVLRLVLEANTREKMQEKVKEISDIIKVPRSLL